MLHFEERGSGPALLLVHGSPLSGWAFRRQLSALSDRYRVIVPDLLGFGASPAVAGGADFEKQAEAFRAWFEGLGLDRFSLLVHDWGGPTALGALRHRLADIDKLVLMNTGIHPDFQPPAYWTPFVSERLIVDWGLVGRGLRLLLSAAGDPAIAAHYRKRLDDRDTRLGVLRFERLEGYRSLMTRLEARLHTVGAETLILYGLPDPYFRLRTLRELQATFPEAHTVTLKGAGHFPMEDAPERVSEVLLRFLAE